MKATSVRQQGALESTRAYTGLILGPCSEMPFLNFYVYLTIFNKKYISGGDGERPETNSSLIDQLHEEFRTTVKEEHEEDDYLCKFGAQLHHYA